MKILYIYEVTSQYEINKVHMKYSIADFGELGTIWEKNGKKIKQRTLKHTLRTKHTLVGLALLSEVHIIK